MRKTVYLVFCLGATLFAQDWVNTLGKAQANAQLAKLWSQQGKPMVEQAITSGLLSQQNQYIDQGNTKVWIYNIYNISIQVAPPPGFQKLDASGLKVRLPLAGSWLVKFTANVKVKQKVAFFWVTKSFKLTATAYDIWARAKADIDSSDPEAPKIAQVPPPEVNVKLFLWTNQWYLNLLYLIFKPQVDDLIEDAMADAIDSITPQLAALQGLPNTYGTGGPGLANSASVDYLTPALKISEKIQQHHLPYGTLLHANWSNPYTGTWEESFAGGYVPGTVLNHGGYGDSAIWTGHQLAAEAFRYKMTGDPQAKQMALTMLAGIDVITQNKGVPGLLNRAVQYPSVTGYPTGENYVKVWNGVEYYCHDFISRDQYMGVFFGCVTAYDFIDDVTVKALAKANIERMLDYLLANDWVAYRKDGSVSTVWFMNCAQQLAWVHAGRRVNPAKYWGKWLQHAFLADLAWFAPWMETFDPVHKYYKFNLQHGSFYTFLRLETSPLLWQRGWKGFRIMRKALAHHQNAHFNLCEVGVAPWQLPSYQSEIKEELRLWLKRPRRELAVDLTNDPSIETAWYTAPTTDGGATPPQLISKYPVPIHKRVTTDFLWQRDPFRLQGGGSGHEESPGTDYVLPYWMARYYGVVD